MINKEELYSLFKEAVLFRRIVHQNPEIGFNCLNTSKRLAEYLKTFKIENFEFVGHSIVGKIENGKGKRIGLRADIDALNQIELTDVPFKSVNNYMHACGHDVHQTILLYTLIYLNTHLDLWSGTVNFVFQEAEEGPYPGGGIKVIESALLDNIDEFYAFHVTNDLDVGEIGIKIGEAMASADTFKITFNGKSGHAAYKDQFINPVDMIYDFLKEIEIIKNVYQNELITVTNVHSGSTYNIVDDIGLVLGIVRTFNQKKRLEIEEKIKNIINSLMDKYKKEIIIEYINHYPSLINSKNSSFNAKEIINKSNLKYIELEKPSMAAEDFSYYINRFSGTLMWLGSKKEEKVPLHSKYFDLSEQAILNGMLVFINLVIA